MLEDEFGDAIAKARRGLGLEIGDVAGATGIPLRDLERMEACALTPDADQVLALAAHLRLRAEPLVDLALSRWLPAEPPTPEGTAIWQVRCLTLASASGFTSNTYFLWHAGETCCVVVDPGFQADRIAEELARDGLRVELVAVTHGHHDHVGEAGTLAKRFDAPVVIGAEDLTIVPAGVRTAAFKVASDGDRVPFGPHYLTVLAAPGHTAGGRVYAVDGVAFVGDTLFASSIGRTFGGPPDYPIHLDTVRQRILAMPQQTILFPGHGPRTTVAEERDHNPFA